MGNPRGRSVAAAPALRVRDEEWRYLKGAGWEQWTSSTTLRFFKKALTKRRRALKITHTYTIAHTFLQPSLHPGHELSTGIGIGIHRRTGREARSARVRRGRRGLVQGAQP